MSRSYRKPYFYWHSNRSRSRDKKLARRIVRHKQNSCISIDNIEDLVIPLRRECTWNSSWSWQCDGSARWGGDRLDRCPELIRK